MPSFSAIEISRMAPVGQTWLHSVQFSSHQPIFEIMIGVQRPSRPASNMAGCKHVGRADPDALVALDATAEELVLGDRAGRPDHAPAEVLPHAAGSRVIGKKTRPKSPARSSSRRPTAG